MVGPRNRPIGHLPAGIYADSGKASQAKGDLAKKKGTENPKAER
jgi:hypothetical protein